MSKKTHNLFVELFPIRQTNLPQLYAWNPLTEHRIDNSLGSKIVYQLTKHLGGHWIFSEDKLITDRMVDVVDIQIALEKLLKIEDMDFSKIRSIISVQDWQSPPLTQAKFIAYGLVSELNSTIRANLKKYRKNIQNAYVDYDYYYNGWVFDNKPVLSISVSSSLYSNFVLANLVRTIEDPSDLLDLFVQDIVSGYKGIVSQIVGPLSNHRHRLLRLTSNDRMRKFIETALDEDTVLKIKSGSNKEYDYISSVLEIIVRLDNHKFLKINREEALNALQLSPELRMTIIQEIADILHNNRFIHREPISTFNFPNSFVSKQAIGVSLKVKLGDGYNCETDARAILSAMSNHPIYRRSSTLSEGSVINITILNLIGDHPHGKKFLSSIRDSLNRIAFGVKFTAVRRIEIISQHLLEQAIDELNTDNPQLMLVFIPNSANTHSGKDIDSIYYDLKTYMLKQGIPSQFISEKTLGNDYTISNIVLGIISKLGNIPCILNEPLPYTDILAGNYIVEVASKKRGEESCLLASTRIYSSNGDFLDYILNTTENGVKSITKQFMMEMFPSKIFADRKVLVHRNGLWSEEEKEILYMWGAEINSQFCLVEIIGSRVPRLYSLDSKIRNPEQGDGLILSEMEALLVSTHPVDKTPRPLWVRSDGNLSIREILHSILSLTVLHYGSVPLLKLPVTVHQIDYISNLGFDEIFTDKLEGTKPFWI